MNPISEIKIDSASIINLSELRKFILNYIDESKEVTFFRVKSIVSDLKNDKNWFEILDEIKNHIDSGFSFSYREYVFDRKIIESMDIGNNYLKEQEFSIKLSDDITINEYNQILKDLEYVCKQRKSLVHSSKLFRSDSFVTFIISFLIIYIISWSILIFFFSIFKLPSGYIYIPLFFIGLTIPKVSEILVKSINKTRFIYILNSSDRTDIYGKPLDNSIIYFIKQNASGIIAGIIVTIIGAFILAGIVYFIVSLNPSFKWPI